MHVSSTPTSYAPLKVKVAILHFFQLKWEWECKAQDDIKMAEYSGVSNMQVIFLKCACDTLEF